VYLPTYIFDYSVLGGGEGYRSFVSGCDLGMPVSGISHKIFSIFEDSLGSVISSKIKIRGPVAFWLANNLGHAVSFIGRVVVKFPFLTIIAVSVFKFVVPRIRNQLTLDQWKEQREHDARQDHYHADHFVDSSFASQRYFEFHREAILRILSQVNGFNHSHYSSTRSSQDQRTEYRNYSYSSGYQEQRRRRTNESSDNWSNQNNNLNDPYDVLGVKKSATMSEVSAAFRREMLKHHPDMNANASEAEKLVALERSKMITEAYRKIKQQSKK